MTIDLPKRAVRGRTFAIIAGLIAVLAIALMAYNVSREIKILGSARSDNVQWALVQSQVEFLEFQKEVDTTPTDVAQLREEFDVFYSRVTTLKTASVFAELRANATSNAHLEDLSQFLEDAVVIIDSSDTRLMNELPELSALAAKAAPVVRALSNSGLDLFAKSADSQRRAVVRTMAQLAFAIVALISALTLIVLYLNRLNRRIYRREQDNNQTTSRMKTVMSTSLDGVIVCDAHGRILEFSPAAEGIFGHVEADVLGRDIGSVIVPDHMRQAHETGMERMRSKGEKRVVGKGRVQLEAKHRDGRIFPVELAIQSATTDEGEIFIAFLRDISRRVAAEAELVAARDKALAGEKLKTDFLSTMSHEIRTPLNGLLGNMNLLRDTKLDANQSRYLGHMETSGRLLMGHISDVLDITRYDAGKLNTRSEPVNISDLLQDIVDNQGGAAAKNETALEWRWIGDPVHWILSDHNRLQHVMMNLVGNAVKFTPHGRVDVTIENVGTATNPELKIRIEDTGQGMSAELAERVFDDFVTGNTAYDRDVGGTGLGLSIAKRFVHALGGDISVESVVGEGSTFQVLMPVTMSEAPEPRSSDRSDHLAIAPLKVLLVEDNEINRIVAREMLEADGHVVVEAHDGAEGVQAAAKEKFSLILMDISMPVMDGRSATRSIRAGNGLSAKTPIVALTANAMAEEQKEFLADGMNDILTKPLARGALRALMHGITARDTAGETAALIDVAHLNETREALGDEAFDRLRGRFIDEVDDLISWFDAQEQLDFAEIAARTHKVAGSAAVFGANQLRENLKSVETSARASDHDVMIASVKKMKKSWMFCKTELRQFE